MDKILLWLTRNFDLNFKKGYFKKYWYIFVLNKSYVAESNQKKSDIEIFILCNFENQVVII